MADLFHQLTAAERARLVALGWTPIEIRVGPWAWKRGDGGLVTDAEAKRVVERLEREDGKR